MFNFLKRKRSDLGESLSECFITCESGGDDGYVIKIKAANLKQLQKIHRLILEIK